MTKTIARDDYAPPPPAKTPLTPIAPIAHHGVAPLPRLVLLLPDLLIQLSGLRQRHRAVRHLGVGAQDDYMSN